MRCSNPSCRKPTCGPREDPAKSINVGVAAHITAASPGGFRYDPSLTDVERSSIGNGLWLCQNCAKLIDSDEARYSVSSLRIWKERAEKVALDDVESTGASGGGTEAVSDDYWRRRRETIQRVLAQFEPVHTFFFKVCIDYMSLVDVLRAGLPASRSDWDKYSGFITEIGKRLHEMHIIEGRLLVSGATKAVAALQQYRLQATEVNDMLRLLHPKLTRNDVSGVTEDLFRRKDRFYKELAMALKSDSVRA